MATISTCSIVERMLEGNGCFPGDSQVSSIWEYRHAITGKIMWAVFYDEAHNDLMTSPFVGEYLCLWNRMAGHVNSIGCLGVSNG